MRRIIALCLCIMAFWSCGAGDTPSTHTTASKKKDSKQYELPFTREKSGGSPVVTIKMNGYPIGNYIWDTGAEITCIDKLQLIVLAQNGKITDNDIIGETICTDATGGQSRCKVFRVKEISIPCNDGKELKCYDIDVALTGSLLLGQNVMQRLPKCSVNDLKQVIVFE